MPTVIFTGNVFGPEKIAEMPDGGRLVDACDAVQAPVPFSCRSATCGTCRLEILEGREHFEPPSTEEAELLAIFGDPPERRLACSARLRAGAGRVRLAIVEDV